MTVAEFEAAVFAQRPTPAEHYDSGYFRDSWRAEGNDYSLETRRRLEGRNPELIRDVFRPRKVLDLGCGPGALMHLLAELGVDVDGVDFSPSSPQLASELVRDRIAIGTTDAPLKPDNSYDLVICREVMEHLTVFQIRRTVQNIVRTTSRYVYCTTRFHPDPTSLVDFTTQFDVDPTHITLLNKDFLRLLFVLEGCRSRPDLEARMDWLNKGRVLVLEKHAPAL
jgi:SAM-dependent methyltransferase